MYKRQAQRGVLSIMVSFEELSPEDEAAAREAEAAAAGADAAEKSAAALNEGITGELSLALFLDLTAEKEAARQAEVARLLALKEEEERAAEQAKQEEIEREANERKQMTAEDSQLYGGNAPAYGGMGGWGGDAGYGTWEPSWDELSLIHI